MVTAEGPDSPLLDAITSFVNLILEGRVPLAVRPVLFGASLTALNKKGGGIRPIAVGYIWRRLTGKVACNVIKDKAVGLLAPRQLGFGVKGGCEGAVHAARCFVENMVDEEVFVKVDFSNAFNCAEARRCSRNGIKSLPRAISFC